MTTAPDILQDAQRILVERANERNLDVERSMERCVNAFNAMYAGAIVKNRGFLTEEWGFRFMALLKQSRALSGYIADDYVDECNYTALAGEARDRENG